MMGREITELKTWHFQTGESSEGLKEARTVEIPHTWNIGDGTEEYWGFGWYGCMIPAPEEWKDRQVRVRFQAVYHDAVVYLNGKEVGRHENSGYTPFEVDLTEALACGQENWLTVRADNRFSDQMLPYMRSFDWANDGGMIRPARLIVTGKHFIRASHVTARPFITEEGSRQDCGMGAFGVTALLGGPEKDGLCLEWEFFEGTDGKERLLDRGKVSCGKGKAVIPAAARENIRFWHFDSPCLYTVKLTLKDGESVEDQVPIVFGFRDFHVKGRTFYLNGEPVRLCGTEWMPGSDPAFGMAEPKEQLEKMLKLLKESNCVFTRFHWQQDDRVYDWCDRHGMLVQEEVPFWGKDPEKAGGQQWKVSCQQMDEMIEAHWNHPSIIAWGVGNELDGQGEETIQYIKDAVARTHRIDGTRLANYVTCTIYPDPAKDGTTDGDVLMINDYIGTWHGERDPYGEWDRIVKANPDKPMVPSEFGLCEPAWKGGDSRREEIFLEKMECYRRYPNIAGTIYFCLNDYRTQMGEDGKGKLRQRIHGSTGLTGEKKPSYYTVQRECAPFLAEQKDGEIRLTCRRDLPCYEMRGYYLETETDTGKIRTEIPNLKPGEGWTAPKTSGEVKAFRIFRPNGDRAL